jgi:hypothetical protein
MFNDVVYIAHLIGYLLRRQASKGNIEENPGPIPLAPILTNRSLDFPC